MSSCGHYYSVPTGWFFIMCLFIPFVDGLAESLELLIMGTFSWVMGQGFFLLMFEFRCEEASEGVIGRVASFRFLFVFSYGSPLIFALTLIPLLILCSLQPLLRAFLFLLWFQRLCYLFLSLLLSPTYLSVINWRSQKVLLAPFIPFGYNMLFNICRSSTDGQIS